MLCACPFLDVVAEPKEVSKFVQRDYARRPSSTTTLSINRVLPTYAATPSHAQSECDPRLWSQVETLVRQRMQPQPATVAAAPRR